MDPARGDQNEVVSGGGMRLWARCLVAAWHAFLSLDGTGGSRQDPSSIQELAAHFNPLQGGFTV